MSSVKKKHHRPYIPPVGKSAFAMADAGRILDAIRAGLPEGSFPEGMPTSPGPGRAAPKQEKKAVPTAFLTSGFAGEGYTILQCGGILHADKQVEITCVGRMPEGRAKVKKVPYWMDRRSADPQLGESQIRLNLIGTPAGVLVQISPVRGAGGRMFRGLPAFHADSRTVHVRLVCEFAGVDMPAPGTPTPLEGDPLAFDAAGLTGTHLKDFPLPIRNMIGELEVERVRTRPTQEVLHTDPLQEDPPTSPEVVEQGAEPPVAAE